MSEPARVLPLPRPRRLQVVRAAATSRARAAWAGVRSAVAAVRKHRAEILQGTAILLGWALVTRGVAPIVAWWGLEVWPLSAGLLLLSVAGWGHLRRVFALGLYALTRGPRR